MFATALLAALQLSGSPVSPAQASIAADIDALIARLPVVREEWTWDAATDGWITRPDVERMQEHVAARELSDAQWERALKRTNVVRWRPEWPARVPFAIGMESPQWIGLARITLTPRVACWRVAEVGSTRYGMCGNSPEYDLDSPLRQELGELTLDQREIVCDVLVEQGVSWIESSPFFERAERGELPSRPRPRKGVEGAVLWRGTVTMPVRAVDSVEEVMPPLRSKHVEDVLARSLSMKLTRVAREEETEAGLMLDIADPSTGELEGTALSVVVDVVCAGQVRERAWFVVEAPRPDETTNIAAAQWRSRRYAWTVFRSLPSTLVEHPETRAAWSLRVRDWPEGALQLWNTRRRWVGDVTVPLADALERGRSR